MEAFADLEITLHRRDVQRFAVELRFVQPESDSDNRLLRDGAEIVIDRDALRSKQLNAVEYGKLLAAQLMRHADVQEAISNARVVAERDHVPLRVRLVLDASAPELHELRWETMRDAEGAPLFLGETIYFSRYLASNDWRPVRPRARGQLRALVVIANPQDLAKFEVGGRKLPAVDVEGELARARTALGDIPITALASGGAPTLNNLVAELSTGYDLLYLAAHGALVSGVPRVWLENDAGNAAVVDGLDLVQRIRELEQRPRLVVLASCQSAGATGEATTTDDGELAALGPRLAEIGVPAVLAMQGNVSMQTVAEFMPVFFRELMDDGRIDRAMSVARGMVRQRADFWMPVLFMRLKSGRLWYTPGFTDPKGFKQWPGLINAIRSGKCTPIIGTGLVEHVIGSTRELARSWADTYVFPMAPYYREDLPQVAQFLAIRQRSQFPRDEFASYLRTHLLERFGPQLASGAADMELSDLLDAVGALRREKDPADPHRVLAELPFKIYITTSPDNLLEKALEAAGKTPRVLLCPWNDYVEQLSEADLDYSPTENEPLIYHLFGQISMPDSLVLTEDDYFDYLIGVTRNNDLLPEALREALVNTALLFLGFQIDDWNFRVLFRSLVKREGRTLSRRYPHIAAQIEPDEARTLDPYLARGYLEEYFKEAEITMYWGGVDDFFAELRAQYAKGSPASHR